MSELDLVAEAYVYGSPLVADLTAVQSFTQDGMGSIPAAPFNQFGHATQLAGPDDQFVSINNDTMYSVAQLDLSAGPLVLQVPDSAGRYYVLQFVDAWTNNFAYVGKRATGTAAGTYVVTPPDWSGKIPKGAVQIASPTMVASIVGRWACDGEDDLTAVAELQEQLTLAPLGAGASAATGTPEGLGIPAPAPGVPEALAFFEKLRLWMRAFPPAAEDVEYQQRFEQLGLLQEDSPYIEPPEELVTLLTEGLVAGKAKVEKSSKTGSASAVNGWHVGPHIFDYNVDHLELGTVDEPEWKVDDRTRGYKMRAIAARVGLWGNHGYEAVYAQVFKDGDGEQLSGHQRYTITFNETPPVDAFWSLTMYDTPDYYLVENPLGRYSIGDRTPGLHKDDDGSLTIYLQRDEPTDPAHKANWLPTPEDDFRPMMRLYQPGDAIFDGTYMLPPIVRRH